MNLSGRGRLSDLVGLDAQQTSDVMQDACREARPVWWDAKWKTKPWHVAAAGPDLAASFYGDGGEDGEDYMAGLAEEIAQCMLQESIEADSHSTNSCEFLESTHTHRQVNLMSTSPQSTLAGMSSWDVVSPGASSNGGMSSGVSSPPTPVDASSLQGRKEETAADALDLLYAELLRLKMEDEIKVRQQQLMQFKQQQHYRQLLWKMRQRKESPLESATFEVLKTAQSSTAHTYSSMCSSNQLSSSAASGYFSSYRPGKLRSNNDYHQNRSRNRSNLLGGGHVPFQTVCSKPSKSWPVVEQSSHEGHTQYGGTHSLNGSSQHNKSFSAVNGSGMRAVFLGTPGARESGGTGVFLPRRVGSTGHESKRRPVCSTVLLPSRIVQALNLNVEDTLACSANPPSPFSLRRSGDHALPARVGSSAPVSAVLEVAAKNNGAGEEWAARGRAAAACSALQEVAPDVCLPTEWTY